jgi:hypothetical protein
MRSTLAISVAAVAMAQDAKPASAVHVAPAGARMAAPLGSRMLNPYGYGGVRMAAPAYAGARVGARVAAPAYAAMNPYMTRAAPIAYQQPAYQAPVAAAPVAAAAPVYDHEEDYENWRVAYITAKAENADSISHSPMLSDSWKLNDRDNAFINPEMATTLRLNFELEGQKGKMQAAEYALNVAAERDAPSEDLTELKKVYEYERLSTMNLMLNNDPVISYQVARQDYEWDAKTASEKLKNAKTATEKREAQLLAQEAQLDLLDAVNPLLGGGLNYGSKMGTMVRYMVDSGKAKNAQQSFDEATRAYQGNPSAVNFYELQIAELKLEKREADYMRTLTGLVSPLAALLNGNYGASLKYKKELTEAKIADLEEKLAAELYKQRHGKEPFGRTDNTPSNAKTQRAFYNLIG